MATCQSLVRDLPETGAEAVYLTWQGDPTTTMTIHWLSRAGASGNEIAWSPRHDDGWRVATGGHRPFGYTDRLVHSVELTGLTPDTDYRFRVEGGLREYVFRTMPADASAPLAFIAGGDVYRYRFDPRIYEAAAAREPHFAIVGGDFVYGNGKSGRADRWVHWLNAWEQYMTTPSGRLVPIVPVIGNHEVRGGFDRSPESAPYFYALFPFPDTHGRVVLDFGDYMSLIVLDSDHTQPIDGEQAAWLSVVLAERSGRAHLFAAYHVPAWPSHRSLEDKQSRRVREHWVPLFEAYGVDACFEHHDHTYKRTHPIRGLDVDPDGVVYLGDGAWGVSPRGVKNPDKTWYLARAEKRNHVFVTTIHGTARLHEAIDPDGVVFDRYPEAGSVVRRPTPSRAASPTLAAATAHSLADP